MKKEDLVVSVVAALELKDKGVPQDSLFYWKGIMKDVKGNPVGHVQEGFSGYGFSECCSAYTSSEIESLLPVGVSTYKRCYNGSREVYVTGGHINQYSIKRDALVRIDLTEIIAETEAESRALALLQLIAKGCQYSDSDKKYKMPNKK